MKKWCFDVVSDIFEENLLKAELKEEKYVEEFVVEVLICERKGVSKKKSENWKYFGISFMENEKELESGKWNFWHFMKIWDQSTHFEKIWVKMWILVRLKEETGKYKHKYEN